MAGLFDAAERIRTSTPLSEHRHLKPGRLPVPPQPLAGATLAAPGPLDGELRDQGGVVRELVVAAPVVAVGAARSRPPRPRRSGGPGGSRRPCGAIPSSAPSCSKPFSSRKASRKPWDSRPRISADSAASQRSPRSARRRPLRSRANVHTRAVGVLPSRRVQVAQHDPRAGAGREVAEHRLVRQHLHEPRLRADRRVHVDDLERRPPGRRARARATARPRPARPRAGSRAAVSTASGLLPSRARGSGATAAASPASASALGPPRGRYGRDLLETYEIGLRRRARARPARRAGSSGRPRSS